MIFGFGLSSGIPWLEDKGLCCWTSVKTFSRATFSYCTCHCCPKQLETAQKWVINEKFSEEDVCHIKNLKPFSTGITKPSPLNLNLCLISDNMGQWKFMWSCLFKLYTIKLHHMSLPQKKKYNIPRIHTHVKKKPSWALQSRGGWL